MKQSLARLLLVGATTRSNPRFELVVILWLVAVTATAILGRSIIASFRSQSFGFDLGMRVELVVDTFIHTVFVLCSLLSLEYFLVRDTRYDAPS